MAIINYYNSQILDNLYKEIEYVEHHWHNVERWFGKKAVPNDEINVMDLTLTPFQLDSGNNDWGTAVCIVGSGDTPIIQDSTLFNINTLLIVSTERTGVHKIRISWGSSEATAISNGTYTERMLNFTATSGHTVPADIRTKKIPAGTKVWANVWCASNTGTLDLCFGFHEY